MLDNFVTCLADKFKISNEEITILLEKFEALNTTTIDYLELSLNSGARYEQKHSYIKVNTNLLLSYRVCLDKVNKRLIVLDERIKGLYSKTDFLICLI